ncbi:leucine-rich repeat-containing protein kinase family protein [Luteolibacter sp. Populi]|uniref:leucine-rich repeat-containing protein kinase family protein n=1 Tax=Luteolibacter sp. Populi TaxID=3230487 RepID=UPI003466DD00
MSDSLSKLRSGQLAGATRIDLSCGLTEFPREIFELADTLEVLNLTGNRLSELPDDLPRLSKLRILFCSANEFRHLPAVLGQCPALEMIGFKSNAIESVTGVPTSLRWLILTDNRIERLPASLGNCTRLQKLMLAGNLLKELPEEMAACRALELVRLSANRFHALPAWLFELPRLAWLALGGNPLSDANHRLSPIAGIPWQAIRTDEILGEGASGTIYKGSWQSRDIAVKIFKGAVTSDGLPADEMAACLAAGDHPHLIPVLGKITDHPTAAQGLVLDLIGKDFASLAGPPSWETCTRDVYREGHRFSRAEALRIANGMAAAGRMLHERGILHGDFYAHNILANAAGDCLLGDFGAASFYPELLPAQALERIEARAFGCLLEELLDRCDDATEEIRELANDCLSPVPAERPLFSAIAERLEDMAARSTC